jgi:hypothetical protein
MSEQAAPAAATATPAAPPAPPSVDMSAFSKLLDLDDAPAAPEPAKPEPKPEARPAAEAKPGESKSVVPRIKEPIDPLDEADFDETKLSSPEAIKAARERLLKARQQQVELTRAAHRAHGAAGRREAVIQRREQETAQKEAAIVAYDRAFKSSIEDLQSGDADRFLTAIHRLGNVGDPAGFWRNVSLKLASGGTFTEAEKKQAQADPEIQRRLQQIEDAVLGKQRAEEDAAFEQQVETAKRNNLAFAAKHEATPRVVAYASDPRTADYTKEALAEIMLSMHRQHGRPIDIASACGILEENLAVHFELSQRANGQPSGQTNRENETTGSVPEAGRAPSQEPPKPATTQPTIPATLSNSPGGAARRLSEDELKREQIRQLEAAGFF